MSNSELTKPLLRGHFHQAGFFISLGACPLLIAQASTKLSVMATLIYALCLQTLLGISALYHRINWDKQKRLFMKRLDHCSIFLLISGTFTPICLLGLERNLALHVVSLSWGIALLGIIQKLIWPQTPKWLSSLIYVSSGWLILPYLPELQKTMEPGAMICLFLGGAIYTLGAIIYALKRPNPFPKVFGYHEIFHVCVNLGVACHFVAVYRLLP